MACKRLIKINGKQVESKLWSQIYNQVGDAEKADRIYAQTLSDDFINWYGDWTGKSEPVLQPHPEGDHLMPVFINDERDVKSPFSQGYYSPIDDNTYYQLTDKEKLIYQEQLKKPGVTMGQSSTLNLLMKKQSNIRITPDHKYFLKGNELKSMTTWIKEQPKFFRKQTDEDLYEKNREWGHIVDDILTGVILGEKQPKVIERVEEGKAKRRAEGAYNTEEGKSADISPRAIAQAYRIFSRMVKESPNSIFMSQIMLYNEEKGIAGTVDIVEIHEDGSISIWDLKTSKDPFFGDFEKVGLNGKVYVNNYNKDPKSGASKRSLHSAQLSGYMGMANAMGIHVNEIKVLPVRIKDYAGSVVNGLQNDRDPNDKSAVSVIPMNVDSTFYEPLGKDSLAEEESVANKQIVEADKMYNSVRLLIQEEIDLLRNKNFKNTGYLSFRLRKLKDEMAVLNRAQALNKFIDVVYDAFLKEEYEVDGDRFENKHGFLNKTRSLIKEINEGKLDPAEAVASIQEIVYQIQIFKPTLNRLMTFYRLAKEDEMLKKSPSKGELRKIELLIEDINKLNKGFGTIEDLASRELNPLLAKMLASTDTSSTKLNKRISNIEKELEALRHKEYSKGTLAKHDVRRKNHLEKTLGTLMGQRGNYEDILRYLNEGIGSDIPVLDMLFNPAVASSNPLIRNFALNLKERLENKRQEYMNEVKDATQALDEYLGKNRLTKGWDTAKLYEGMFKKVSHYKGGEMVDELSLVQDVDMDRYNKARHVEYEAARQEMESRKAAGMSSKRAENLRKARVLKWLGENTEAIPREDVTVTNPYTNEKVVIYEGLDTIIARKAQEKKEGYLSEFEYKQWLNYHFDRGNPKPVMSSSMLRRPSRARYPSKAYNEMLKNPSKKKLYDLLVATYFKHQNLVPDNKRLGFVLPYIPKSLGQAVRERDLGNNLAIAKDRLSEIVQPRARDEEHYGQVTASGKKIVPVLFSNKGELTADEVSNDLMSSIMRYAYAAKVHNVRSDMTDISQALLNRVKSVKVVKTSTLGKQIVKKAAKVAGVSGVESFLGKEDSNIAKLLEAFIDMQIYGKTKEQLKVEIAGKEFDLAKSADNLMAFSRFINLGFNPIFAISQTLQSNMMLVVESAAKDQISPKSWAKGQALYVSKVMPQLMKDVTEPVAKSFWGQLIEMYDPYQGYFRDETGRVLAQPMIKKKFSSDAAFLTTKSEHQVQTIPLVVALMEQTVKINGQDIPLMDAYELGDDGRIKLKDGVDLSSLGRLTENKMIPLELQNKIHGLNRTLHMAMGSVDRTVAEKFTIGRLFLMYKKWMPPGFKKRWKKEGYDAELDQMTEGFYLTLIRDLPRRVRRWLNKAENDYTLEEWERSNLMRAAAELASIIALLVGSKVLLEVAKGFDDEDEGALAMSSLGYFAFRLYSEMAYYINPKDSIRMFYNPFAAAGTVRKMANIGEQMVSDAFGLVTEGDIERYKVRSGMAEKGDSKLKWKLYKMIGLTDSKIDPERALEILRLSRF